MTRGLSVLEVIIALTISLSVISIIFSNISQSAGHSKKINSQQEVLESIFHTVDMIKSDLTKCGMRLQEAVKYFDISVFENTENHFKITFGISSEVIKEHSFKGDRIININKNEFFSKRKKVLIYNIDTNVCEFNEIKEWHNGEIILQNSLQNDYFKNSIIIAVKKIEYKFYQKQNVFKRKIDGGYFQPLVENVTDFYIKFFPESNSVLYRIEINKKEQIRGYIFLINKV